MAVPTLRLPSKYPSLPEGMAKNQGLAAGRRYMLKHGYKPYFGNTKYRAKFDRNNEALFNDDFDTVLYQPTPLINVVTSRNPGLLQVV
jgi:hypothetical protein